MATAREARKLGLGECRRVKTGRNANQCTIELCRTGKGKTGYEFQRGSRRCSR